MRRSLSPRARSSKSLQVSRTQSPVVEPTHSRWAALAPPWSARVPFPVAGMRSTPAASLGAQSAHRRGRRCCASEIPCCTVSGSMDLGTVSHTATLTRGNPGSQCQARITASCMTITSMPAEISACGWPQLATTTIFTKTGVTNPGWS